MLPLLFLLLVPAQDFGLDRMDAFQNHGGPNDLRVVLNKVHKSVKCDKNSLYVVANDDELTVTGSCQRLHIEGKGNQVTIDTVGLVEISGSDNIVHISQSIPRIGIHGKGNKVFHPGPPPVAGATPPSA